MDEPCSICGDDTGVGTPLYSDRTVVTLRSGAPAFACASCMDRVMRRHRRRQFTDEEAAQFIENVRLAGMVGDH